MADAPSAGGLLIASPGMHSGVFDRTVILLLQHDSDGSMGLVLNRPSQVTATEALPDFGPIADPDIIFLGGPVEEGTALVLAEAQDSHVGELHFERDGVGLVDLGARDGTIGDLLVRVRVYSGYSGWETGQLEDELRSGAWIVADAEPGDLWHQDSNVLWASVLHRQQGMTRFLASYPDQPWLN